MYNRTLLFSSTILKHGRHFDYWNLPVNMRMCVCYLNCFYFEKCIYKNGLGNAHPARYLICHEAGLCCYLVIHTENLL
jgi:hypothetical protein